MFPLSGKSFPKSQDELITAVRGALEDVFSLPQPDKAVTASGGTYPVLKKLTINLNDARVTAKEPPPPPEPTGKASRGITVEKLDLTGEPVHYENAKANFRLRASDVKLDFSKDKSGQPLLVLKSAADGQAEVNVTAADLQAIVLAGATAAAAEQGVTVKDIELKLTSEGDRSVSADVRVTAKKAMVKGVVHLTGRADVDDEMNATLSNLSCNGEGMVGKIASGFLAGYLKKYDGQQFPLMAFSLGNVTLRDVKVDAKDGIHVTAKFGGK